MDWKAIEDKDALAHFDLARAFLEMDLVDDAIATLDRAITLHPDIRQLRDLREEALGQRRKRSRDGARSAIDPTRH